MSRNGRERESSELRREAARRRESMKQTAMALEDRLRERTEQISDAVGRTRQQVGKVDQLVRRHPYLFLGGAIGAGLALSRSSSNRLVPIDKANGRGAYVLVERRQSGLVRSLLGPLAAFALRQTIAWLAGYLDGPHGEESHDDDDPRMLLPPPPPPPVR